jgi:2-polyprenyl-6-methoxyphenol hydroxylase-like FAD-dependent oxidoreductase
MMPSGRLIFHRNDPVAATSDSYSPEIDRADLNRILCESLPHDAVHWGYKIVHVSPHGDEYVLSFANGATAVADLVVGADGAWSRIRPLVTAETPVYSGVTFLDCTLRDFDSRFPELVDLVGHGSLYAFGGGNALITQRNGYGVLRLYLGFKTHETWAADSDVVQAATDHDRSQLLIQTRYVAWHDRLQKLIIAAGSGEASSMVARPLYALSLGHKWTHRVGVTLIGDAAHLMSPCAGEGVNMAMLDALQLAETITHAFTTPDTSGNRRRDAVLASIADFERTMWERVTQPMQRSADNLELFVDQGELALEQYVKRVTAST